MNEMQKVPVVAVFVALQLKAVRSVCRGIIGYGRRRGPWRLLFPEGRPKEQALDLKRLDVDGIIVQNTSAQEADAVATLGIPVVLSETCPEGLGKGHLLANAPFVMLDNRAVGALAAAYFLQRGYKSFAYVDERGHTGWGAARQEGFVRGLAEAGFQCALYGAATIRERRSWAVERPRMIRFLENLPKPTAVFAAMDGRARLVLDACAAAAIRVPEEIAVLGVDDDPLLCESTHPALSSIRTGGFQRGWKAAEMLDNLMRGKSVPRQGAVMEPLTIVTRESTGYDAMRDPILARALKAIHAEAGRRHFEVVDAVAAANCSRRYLETHVRRHLGTTVRDLILREKIERVKSLLETTALTIGEIVEETGFLHDSHLTTLFKQSTDTTMTAWRRAHRDAADE